MTKNTYDAIPYDSYPYVNSQPDHLYMVGSLFQTNPVNPKNCRVLELGCASGGNLVCSALKYPESTFIGVDLSEDQIKEANKQAKDLGLKNITFHVMSLTDINKNFGEFDYIMAHGVLSWIPKDAQNSLLRVYNENLSPNGLAYVSYNVLPGWNMVKSVREMMLYHTEAFDDPHKKIVQARSLLSFLNESLKEQDTPYANLLRQEATILNNQPDMYIFHEHLEACNEQFYFHDVMNRAAEQGLQYLGDADLSSMFIGNLPEKAIKTLGAAKDDIVRLEQYMDFVTNRRFRSTIFCHQGVNINRNLKPEIIDDFFISTNLHAEKPIDLAASRKNPELEFKFTSTTRNIAIKGLGLTALMKVISEQNGHPLSVSEWISKTQEQLEDASDTALKHVIHEHGLRLMLGGLLNFSKNPATYELKPSKKPQVQKLAAYQLKKDQMWVTSARNERLTLSLFDKIILKNLNGQHTIDDIVGIVVKEIEKGTLALNDKGKNVEKVAAHKKGVQAIVKAQLSNIASSALLDR